MERSSGVEVSIIVPVYNTEKYLDKCIGGILSQTFRDFELILVNDGSKDSSLSILKNYERQDGRISVIDKENTGAGDSRNIGIWHAKGKYICFIDSDDWVETDYISSLLKGNLGEDTLVVHNVDRNMHLENGIYKMPSERDALFLKNNFLSFGYSVAKLFSRRLIQENSLGFPKNITLAEDLVFLLEYLNHVSAVKIENIAKYHYTYNPHSLSAKKHSFESLFAVHNFFSHYLETLAPKSKKLEKYIISADWDTVETSLHHGIQHNSTSDSEKRKKLSQLEKTLHYKHFLYASNFRRILFLLLKMKLYPVILKILSHFDKK